MQFNEEQVLSMAPDDASKKSGKELANASKWVKMEQSERAVWGECKGSGKLPYQTQVDLTNIAFKCSCPSRKFPCKHGLGLLLLYGRDANKFKQTTEPDWVVGWLDKRNEKAEKKEEKKSKSDADPAAQAKRQENRIKRVSDGAEELLLWIKDIVRNGFITIPTKDASYFENMAKRMIDAQAPGLATMVRELGAVNFYQDGWQTPFLDQLVRMYLVINGLARIEHLPDNVQQEIKSLIGFTQSQDDLKMQEGIRDNWFVLAKQVNREDNLSVERNWLCGVETNKFALVIQFYVRNQLPEVNLVPGSSVDAELVFFKGIESQRALIKTMHGVTAAKPPAAHATLMEVAESIGDVLTRNPFIEKVPVILGDVEILQAEKQWLLKDRDGRGVTIAPTFKEAWKMLALSGGNTFKLFVLGSEQTFEPLGIWVNDQYKILA